LLVFPAGFQDYLFEVIGGGLISFDFSKKMRAFFVKRGKS